MELLNPVAGFLLWIVLPILSIILFLTALISVLKSTFRDKANKVTWLLLIILIPILGSIFYFLIGRKQRIKIE